MPAHSCTLKDIALKCGVSSALVSSVLNGRAGTTKCSAAKRELILNTAREMEYHPNILARSIKKSRVPIVGIFLRYSAGQSHVLGRSISSRLGTLTPVLNAMHHEVLFVPFSDVQEQYSRMKSLIAQGLLGGIITNIDFHDNLRVCELLQSSKLPYLVLGKPSLPGTFCIYSSSKCLEELCFKLASERNCSRCVSVEPGPKGSLIFRPMPFPEGHIWAAQAISLKEAAADAGNTLFVLMGCILVERLHALGILPQHYVCVDPAEDMEKLEGMHDTFFMKRASATEDYLRNVFGPWLLNATKPPITAAVNIIDEHQFIFKRKFI